LIVIRDWINNDNLTALIEGQTLPVTTSQFLPGSIHDKIPFWKDTLTSSPWVIQLLTDGYKVPFTTLPGQYYEPNNQSALKNPDIVIQQLLELEALGVLKGVDTKPTCVSPLGLISKTVDGKLKHRLVFDASRWVNNFVSPPAVKLTFFERALELITPNCIMGTFDLRSAYYHVRLYDAHQQYFGVAFTINGSIRYYQFQCLPFGLNSAVHCLTKIWKPLLAYLHKKNVKLSICIDDGLFVAESLAAWENNRKLIHDVLEKAGWYLADEKSDGSLE